MKRILNLTFLIGTLLVSCSNDDDNSTIENNCDSTSEIITEEDFNEIQPKSIQDMSLGDDSIKGCD